MELLWENLEEVQAVFLQPVVTTLPLTCLWLLIGIWRRCGWLHYEFALPFVPWTIATAYMGLFLDERYFDYGYVSGIFGGLVLLPRLFFPALHVQSRWTTTSLATIAATLLSLCFIGSSGPVFRY